MKTERELITQMLDCIATLRHSSNSFAGDKKAAEAMQAAREYLAAPEQSEPVAWMCSNNELMYKGYQRFAATAGGDWNIPVYTHPAPKAEPLTDTEFNAAVVRAVIAAQGAKT